MAPLNRRINAAISSSDGSAASRGRFHRARAPVAKPAIRQGLLQPGVFEDKGQRPRRNEHSEGELNSTKEIPPWATDLRNRCRNRRRKSNRRPTNKIKGSRRSSRRNRQRRRKPPQTRRSRRRVTRFTFRRASACSPEDERAMGPCQGRSGDTAPSASTGPEKSFHAWVVMLGCA